MSSWRALEEELDRWSSEKKTATFWWRDDDMSGHTEALDRLMDLKQHLDIPLTLAVIPHQVDIEVADYLEDCEVVQHGFAHQSYAGEGEKKSEFPTSRETDAIKSDLENGFQVLKQGFPDQFFPFFVPPWNRYADEIKPLLDEVGFVGISQFKSREQVMPCDGVIQVNTHIDPVDWRGDRGAIEEDKLLTQLVELLQDRRKGVIDPQEPIGFLSHHLMFNEDLWRISHKLLSFLAHHSAVRFLTLRAAISLLDEFDLVEEKLYG